MQYKIEEECGCLTMKSIVTNKNTKSSSFEKAFNKQMDLYSDRISSLAKKKELLSEMSSVFSRLPHCFFKLEGNKVLRVPLSLLLEREVLFAIFEDGPSWMPDEIKIPILKDIDSKEFEEKANKLGFYSNINLAIYNGLSKDVT